MNLNYKKVRDVKDPIKTLAGNAGIDFFIPYKLPTELIIKAGDTLSIPSGIVMDIPLGLCMLTMNKSGMLYNEKLECMIGLIDSSYTGEISFLIRNMGRKDIHLVEGRKICQGIILPDILVGCNLIKVEQIDKLTARGTKGFGSTGVH